MGRLYNATTQTTPTATTGRLYGGKKPDLTTPAGLQQTAVQTGVGAEATKIVSQKGENPEQIFSGGFISDVFDGLNALQHGVTGTLQGKGFARGVKERASFTEKDQLGQYGIPGVIGGIALDIAVDPLTYIAPVSVLKKVPGVAKAVNVASDAIQATQIGKKLGSTFIYRFGQDPVYKAMAERTEKNIAVGIENMMEIARPITKLDSATQKVIAEARKAGDLSTLAPDILVKAKPAFDELDRLGQEAVNVGLLKKEVYDEHVGSYMARLYMKHETPRGVVEKVKTFFDKKPVRVDRSRFMKRTDIPEDVREAMGEILEAGYPTAKGLVQLTQAVERAKFFKEVSSKFAKDTVEDGFVKLSDAKTLGDLAGKAVPKPIYDDIQQIIRQKTDFEKTLGKVVAGFKYGKVVLNPATHARNIMSNFLLNNFEGLSPARLDIYAQAAKEIAKKGDVYKEAKAVGLGLDTFAAQELKDILIGANAGKLKKSVRAVANTISDLYQKEEEWGKMAQYIYQRGKGLTPEDAFKVAERATFNYAQVTPFIRRLRESVFGFPFITFTYKATPQIVRTVATKPTKISNIGKIKTAIENQSNQKELEAERSVEPKWMRDGFFVKLPVKDKEGRSAYLDLTYIIPFGDLVSGGLISRDLNRETGLPEGIGEALASKSPAANLVKEMVKNQDFYGNKIFKESDNTEKQLGDIFRHMMKTYLPPTVSDQIPGGYDYKGERRQGQIQRALAEKKGVDVGGKQDRTLMEELLKHAGLKIQPFDLETQSKRSERETKNALQTLLKERGTISDFSIPYIPKKP